MNYRLGNQPKYKIGQKVAVKVKSKYDAKESVFEFDNMIEGHISVIKAAGTSEKDTYSYGITTDMPRCYHSGKEPFMYILEDSVKVID
ncbi:hypothetical protein [Proteiniphilum sp. X52]|uniref:hypothetical protein n=1 Tax=Proteiniphilum sp. X52 TaxID=2382159 RepID=UPI000F0A1851|nr:hypothetical protein [Proteiniphilum sp. X52]RNC66446.1 hypothetical protein D7D25_02920 [Proteiniphilum sp. X52]